LTADRDHIAIKRPRDFNQAAKLVVDIATGDDVEDRPPTHQRNKAKTPLRCLGSQGRNSASGQA
jgi:hypothetical protein